jgi:hypothetical protein
MVNAIYGNACGSPITVRAGISVRWLPGVIGHIWMCADATESG